MDNLTKNFLSTILIGGSWLGLYFMSGKELCLIISCTFIASSFVIGSMKKDK